MSPVKVVHVYTPMCYVQKTYILFLAQWRPLWFATNSCHDSSTWNVPWIRMQWAQSKCSVVMPKSAEAKTPSATKLNPRAFSSSAKRVLFKTSFWLRSLPMMAWTETSSCCTNPSSDGVVWAFSAGLIRRSSDDFSTTLLQRGHGRRPEAPLNS